MRINAVVLAACAIMAMSGSAQAGWDSHAPRDACLVGTWKMTSGGAEEWMRRNIHKAHVTAMSAQNNTITLKADGTFMTGHATAKANVEANDGTMHGTGTMQGQASGHWSAGRGTLKLFTEAMNAQGKVTITGPDGRPITVNTHPQGPQDSAMTYSCRGAAFTTTQPMPRGTAMTTTYTKLP